MLRGRRRAALKHACLSPPRFSHQYTTGPPPMVPSLSTRMRLGLTSVPPPAAAGAAAGRLLAPPAASAACLLLDMLLLARRTRGLGAGSGLPARTCRGERAIQLPTGAALERASSLRHASECPVNDGVECVAVRARRVF